MPERTTIVAAVKIVGGVIVAMLFFNGTVSPLGLAVIGALLFAWYTSG
jgi:hypothetical protein